MKNVKIATTSFLCCYLFIASSSASAVLLDFEGLPDLQSVTNQYATDGVIFSNTVALTAGYSLNEIDYPPHSGQVVVGDDGNGPMEMTFKGSMKDVSAWFSYSTQLTINVYGVNGSFLGTVNSAGSSNLGSNTQIALGYQGISRLQVAGASPETFVMDDLSMTPVPEPDIFALFGIGFTGIFFRLRNQRKTG